MINAGEIYIKKVGRGGTEMVKGRKRKRKIERDSREVLLPCCYVIGLYQHNYLSSTCSIIPNKMLLFFSIPSVQNISG